MLSHLEIRQGFLNYFREHNHRIYYSYPLIPANDPTLLFTNAGMVQFKEIFQGNYKSDFNRATSSQKCLRVSGKHNDLENVGRTPRHHTFFEMLGNFSFGDYFKEGAIFFAWDFFINQVGLKKEDLWVSVYKDDDEAYQIWQEKMGVSPDRILRLGEKDNFWSMGDTGPCGPCSEILIDMGEKYASQKENSTPVTDDARFMELWNLVFMQFDRSADGTMRPLPKPCIDTGMGLERLCAVAQGKYSNYDSDLFDYIIQTIADLVEKKYGENPEDDVAMRVIADHSRSTVFLIADGVLPGRDERNYVLRRIMRRAIRFGHKLGFEKPFLHQVCKKVVGNMGAVFPELGYAAKLIDKTVLEEEEQFRKTLLKGLSVLESEIENALAGDKVLSGKFVWFLDGTHGFPVDLTEMIALENGCQIDIAAYHTEREEERKRGRQSWDASVEQFEKYGPVRELSTEFVGYTENSANSEVQGILVNGNIENSATAGDTIEIILNRSPFYGESGGQVGDSGTIFNEAGLKIEVQTTLKPYPELMVHQGVIRQGDLRVNDTVTAKIDDSLRNRIPLNHSATHLLQASLRKVLGLHVKQKGSVVEAGRLRFDYSHPGKVSAADFYDIEKAVNEMIRANVPVQTELISLDEGMKRGAIALFEEKYASKVRLVQMGEYSKELCGGTHVQMTGDIGFFKMVSEGAIASGVRRIEAVTGEDAVKYVISIEEQLTEAGIKLRTNLFDVSARVNTLLETVKSLEKENATLQSRLQGKESENFMASLREIQGVKVIATEVNTLEGKVLREYGDKIRDRIQEGVICMAGRNLERIIVMIMVTKAHIGKYHAGEILKKLAPIIGGKGGGKPDMAQGGGDKPENIEKLFEAFYQGIT